MFTHLKQSVIAILAITVLCGLLYPLAMTGLSGILFPYAAHGSLIERNGKIIGSDLIGQNFTHDRYFHPRPSETTTTDSDDLTKTVPDPYNAANSGASNYAPTSHAMIDKIKSRINALKSRNPMSKGQIPVDLVTSSASGLDPDISPASALYQVPRIAKARNVSEATVKELVKTKIEGRLYGLLGEPRVNVLKLNLALDEAFSRKK